MKGNNDNLGSLSVRFWSFVKGRIGNNFARSHYIITSFCGHFTCIEILWKVVKWSMKWLYSIQWKCFVTDTPSFCDHMWSHVEFCCMRWCWHFWKSPITAHQTLSSNVAGFNSRKIRMLHYETVLIYPNLCYNICFKYFLCVN